MSDEEVPEGTFGSYSPSNKNARRYPSRYEICDSSGFRVQPGSLVKQWDGARVMRRFRDDRNEQDLIRPRAPRSRETARSPEPEVRYLSAEVGQEDL